MSETHTIDSIVETVIALTVSSQNNETLAKWVELHDIGVSLAFAHREQMITGLTTHGEQVIREAVTNLASSLETTVDYLVDIATSPDEVAE
jgi:hypothetical protein